MANEFYQPGDQRAAKVNDLFAAIAPRYDFINDLQSFGLHRWWKNRLVPEMQRNFDYLEGQLANKDSRSLAQAAVLLEDAVDMHDRHWKIHWMLNFAQLSATLNLKAVMQETHGKVDDVLLGRLQNSAFRSSMPSM